MKKFVFLPIALIFAAIASVNAQSKLTLEISGIDNPTGSLYVALYDAQSPFLGKNNYSGKIVGISNNIMEVGLDNVADGQYAIAIFQDENQNGKLDMGQWGIPTEKYGFSNNVDPAIIKRPPSFEECKFEVKGDSRIEINLMSAIK
ncbi:DUF2141 domain-containing protein [Dysgonomonas sp. 511]|uniref:DUF2141 domain-containing protein n=1 Tax=Dysgonomonas sp. 511 TaxID=2302930 RepID=UPI0013D0C22B|nr:DUF2141 domain-containing protein [Dysgonomonas sp. 511]NDV77515.1 DUF2141 domain-containing protein [Dysgonomonas sp. 511]